MSVLIVALLGVILAIIPGKVAELEKHKRFGWLWRIGLPLFLVLVGVSGFLQGCNDKAQFRNQISQLTSQVTVEATRDDIANLTKHMDDGFNKVMLAIQALADALRGIKSKPIPPIQKQPSLGQTQQPPPILQHIRFSQSRVPSTLPEAPYGTRVIIQTDISVKRPKVEIDFDGAIHHGDFFMAGRGIYMIKVSTVTNDDKSLVVSCEFPEWTPDAPIVATVESREAVTVTGVRLLQ